MAPSASDRPTYTPEQLQRYFSHVGLPKPLRYTKDSLQSLSADKQLDFISTLVRHQLCNVPFENLDLHYATVKGISLDPTHLYDKVVVRNAGRGGYCMQNNSFFGTILRSLGFSIMSAGARVAKAVDDGTAGEHPVTEAEYGGYSHQVNIITLENGKKYFADVGFGASGPTFAVPLENGFSRTNTGTTERVASSMKLARGFTANNTARNPEQELWIFSVKYGPANDDSKHWIPSYCFSETEYFPRDFEIMSAFVSTHRTSMFVQKVICQKFVMNEDGESLIGDITLNDGAIKKREFGESTVLAEIKSEEDRVDALQKFLGVKLDEAERSGIKGFPTAIQ